MRGVYIQPWDILMFIFYYWSILSFYITAEPDNFYKTVWLDIIRVESEFSASNTA